MKSVFDLEWQNVKTEYRIVAALEKISAAFRVLLWKESKINRLSPIQIQLLIFIKFQPRERATVTHLAREFNMTKATVSDSVRVLEQKKLVVRKRRNADNRSFSLTLTASGEKIAKSSSLFANALQVPVQVMEPEHKANFLNALLDIIHALDESKVIATQRMCKTCCFFKPGKTQHYCGLIKQTLNVSDLRLDCPEHKTRIFSSS